jgi:hypothetical protein
MSRLTQWNVKKSDWLSSTNLTDYSKVRKSTIITKVSP